MKKFFLFAAALVASVTASAQLNVEYCAMDSAKLASIAGELATKTYSADPVAAGTVFHDGTNMTVSLPFAQQLQWVSAAQPNGAHKKIQINDVEVNMNEGIQGKDNPKDADGNNPCNVIVAPTQGACYQVTVKEDGWVVVLHKATSNKQYFVFENGNCVGYKFGMMTYATPSLGEDGLLKYILTGDQEYNYLTAATIEQLTGFPKIEFVENYVNLDTIASGIGLGQYKQNGVSAIAFLGYQGCTYLVGAAGSKMTCAGIAHVKGLNGTLPVLALGESITPDGATEPTVYPSVELVQLEGVTALNNIEGSVKAQKVVRNGQVLIFKDGVAYTVLGTIAK